MLSPIQQAQDLIRKNKNILIALPESLNGDSLGSALALSDAIKKLGKKVEIATDDRVSDKLLFLSGAGGVKNGIHPLRDFIISVNTRQNKISRLRYENETNVLKIFLATPQKIEQKDITLEPGPFYYDLIITLDAPDMESLGRIFNDNPELFFNKSILNIDHKAGNEYFGEVNLIEPTAASCSEIVADLIEKMGQDLISADAATALLAGLIIKTNSWQNAKTTPQSLNLASSLIIKGADQEKIIKYLYKTKPLNCLKLWGRLLGRLEFNEQQKSAWLIAEPEDFSATDTSPKDIPFVLDEICDLLPLLNLSIIFWTEDGNALCIMAQSKQTEPLQKITLEMGGSIKNNRLLIKNAGPSIQSAKEKLTALLNLRQ